MFAILIGLYVFFYMPDYATCSSGGITIIAENQDELAAVEVISEGFIVVLRLEPTGVSSSESFVYSANPGSFDNVAANTTNSNIVDFPLIISPPKWYTTDPLSPTEENP